VGDARLLWFEARVGVYLTELLEELVSDVPLSRRVRTGILEAGEVRSVACLAACELGPSPANVDVAALPARSWCGALNVVAGSCAALDGVSSIVSTPAPSSSVPSNVGIPKPGEATSCPLTTSPKNGCRPPDTGLRAGVTLFFFVGDICWSRLLLLPVVRRVAGAFRGAAGAGCGLSLGFRLLNL
jgi:hypothetical protein